MNFAAPWFLLGTALALLVGALLVLGSLANARAVARFGDPERVRALFTADPAKRRAWKGVLLVVAVALAFVAAAQPQYGKGTRLVPATNVDVVIVLDYSKSMYARDVEPSRIFRAKIEVARLVHDLEGARFAAVAFAGEPMGFPLTADGVAVAQFLRQLDPNDMPVGGTAIARALEQARELLQRDPKAAEHKRIILLVTDGEDLEGDPEAAARSIGAEGTVIHVVQIGGRTPERIPEIGADGKIAGWRTDRQGKPLTTALTVEGEKQLAMVAQAGNGKLVRAERGTTGIDQIAAELKKQMRSELGEKVETVYADVYYYPLVVAILLLIAEVFVGDTRPRIFVRRAAPVATKAQLRVRRALGRAKESKHAPIDLLRATALGLGLAAALACAVAGCSGWDPRSPFEHNAPEVDQALRDLDAGHLQPANEALARYLGTGPCSADAGVALPPSVRQKPSGAFDLGLTLFALGEQFGQRFGDEERAAPGAGQAPPGSPAPHAQPGPSPRDQALAEKRALEVGCALIIVRAIAADSTVPAELRARAHYLAGNLELLLQKYEEAVKEYDQALALVPGLPVDAGGDGLGRDAAWNRAIALRRQEQQDAGNDSPDASDAPDSSDGSDGSNGNDGGDKPDAGNDGGDKPDAGNDGGDKGDAGNDGGDKPDAGDNQDGGGTPPPPQPASSQSATPQQDSRMLEQLEQAPSYQGQEAKQRAAQRRGRPTMEDK